MQGVKPSLMFSSVLAGGWVDGDDVGALAMYSPRVAITLDPPRTMPVK